MIISKYHTAYDTRDGTEQPAEQPISSDGCDSELQRWDNEGGPANDAIVILALVPERPPAWSVLSLRDLNAKIAEDSRVDGPWQKHVRATQIENQMRHDAAVQKRQSEIDVRARRVYFSDE